MRKASIASLSAVAVLAVSSLMIGKAYSQNSTNKNASPHVAKHTRRSVHGKEYRYTTYGWSATHAPAGFDNKTNGAVDQETFDKSREVFEEREEIADGLGPVYNAQSCAECHQTPVTGAISQVNELRAGTTRHKFFSPSIFTDAPGGSLINDRALSAVIQETVNPAQNTRTFRTSLNTLGDGFVEAIADSDLIWLVHQQTRKTHGRIAGMVVKVPVLESPGVFRVGRFGWKNQHASLVSFSADAYLNEMGITNPLLPSENTSLGRSVAEFDTVADPEDDGEDVRVFAQFMRSTTVPPHDEKLDSTPEAAAGERVFRHIGCELCHHAEFTTLPVGTLINGNFTLPAALGNKIIHPYGDFLLHDVGTGDGIVQNGGPATANRLRTPPLWGVRTRTRLMHDGASLTFEDAIRRHRGEAKREANKFHCLSKQDKEYLITFLKSL